MARLALICVPWAPAAGAAEVAVLKSSDAVPWRAALEAFRRSATAHAIAEFDLRGDRSEAERIVQAVRGRNAILLAMGPLAAQTARSLAPEALLVFCMIPNPEKLDLLSRPNVAGVTYVTPVKNQLAAFRLVYPRGVRIGVLFADEWVGRLVEEAKKAASVVRLVVVARRVGSEKDVPQALRALLRGDDAADALWVPPDPLLLGEETRRFLFSETLKAGKPIFTSSASLVPEGALAASGPDYASIGELAADLVNRLAAGDQGARGALLVPRGELVINKRIAEKLRVEIPVDAFRAASRVY